jgi:dihydroorotate dehydrogenase (fumarate)
MFSQDFPVFNASGVWCTTKKELEDLGKSEASAIVFKTMTLESRQGNPKPRFFLKDNFSINSMGLPNLGVDYYCNILKDLKKYKKPLIASIAGFSQKEFLVLFDKVNSAYFDMVEVNLSCPNLEGKGLFAYDLKTSFSILKKIMKKTKKKVGVKLPPYFEREIIKKVAE